MLLEPREADAVRDRFGTPCYVYDEATLAAAARTALAFPAPYGLTVRYAMKANPNRRVLGVFRDLGLHIDASSEYEVERALAAGFPGDRIQLTSQMPPRRLDDLIARGVLFNACSPHQLERYAAACPGGVVSVRVNPGLGSGSTNRTNTGGPGSSFGIWHAYLDDVRAAAARHDVTIARLHTHIGSGSDPAVWTRVARLSLDIAERLPDVTIVNLGGGFKVARVDGEQATDLAEVGAVVCGEIEAFAARTGRPHHELEQRAAGQQRLVREVSLRGGRGERGSDHGRDAVRPVGEVDEGGRSLSHSRTRSRGSARTPAGDGSARAFRRDDAALRAPAGTSCS